MPAEREMNLKLEVRPGACLFVLGPTITGSKSCKQLLESALQYLEHSTEADVKRKVLFELNKLERAGTSVTLLSVVEVMKEHCCFSEWLHTVFEQDSSSAPSCSPTLHHFVDLHKQGSLLACVQMDTAIDSFAFSTPATLEDEVSFESWSSNSISSVQVDEDQEVNVESNPLESSGVPVFLHLCGVYNKPETISTRPTVAKADALHSSSSSERVFTQTCAKLKKILLSRLVVFVGFDEESQNPFLRKFLEEFYSSSDTHAWRNPPVLLTSKRRRSKIQQNCKNQNVLAKFLQLEVQSENGRIPPNLISPGPAKNLSINKGLSAKNPDRVKMEVFLLFNEKQSFRRLGEIVYPKSQSCDIYVRRDALTIVYDTGHILYGNIITYGESGLRQLWELVLTDDSTLLGKGLVAFGLQDMAIVWIRGKPSSLGNVANIKSVHTNPAHQTALVMSSTSKPNGAQTGTAVLHSHLSAWSAETSHDGFPLTNNSNSPLSVCPDSETNAGGSNPPSSARHIQNLLHSRKIPGPPKLIKIPLNDPLNAPHDQHDSSSVIPTVSFSPLSKFSPVSSASHALNSSRGYSTAGDQCFQFPPSLPTSSQGFTLPSTLLQPGKQSLNGTNGGNWEQESQYLKSVVELQEKINQQLDSSNRYSVMDNLSPSRLLYDQDNDLLTPFQPPQYCIAAPPERLLDIITHSSCVKQHKHEIQTIDIRKPNPMRTPPALQNMLSNQTLVSPLPATHGSKHTQLVLTNLPYAADISRERATDNGPPVLVSQRNVQETSSLPKIITTNKQNLKHISNKSANHPLISVMTKNKRLSSTSNASTANSNSTLSNPHLQQGKQLSLSAHIPISKFPFSGSPIIQPSQQPPPAASLEASANSSPSSHTLSDRGRFVSATHSAPVMAGEDGIMKMTNLVSPSQPAMMYSPQSLVMTTPNQSQYCLSINPLAGLSPVQMLLVTPVTTLVPQIPLALNNSMSLTSAAPASSDNTNQVMYYLPPNGLVGTQGVAGHDKTLQTDHILSEQTNGSGNDELWKTKGLTSMQMDAASAIRGDNVPVSLGMSVSVQDDLLPSPVKRAKFRSPGDESDLEDHFRPLAGMCMEHVIGKTNMFSHNEMSRSDSSRPDINGSQDFSEDISDKQLVLKERVLDNEPEQITNNPSATTYTSTSESNVQLWLFLLDLLLAPQYKHIVYWTGNGYEFRIAHPAGLAKLWGNHRNRPQMTYEKMSRALRYYYSRGILASVKGRKQTFKFTMDLQGYVAGHKDDSKLAYFESSVQKETESS